MKIKLLTLLIFSTLSLGCYGTMYVDHEPLRVRVEQPRTIVTVHTHISPTVRHVHHSHPHRVVRHVHRHPRRVVRRGSRHHTARRAHTHPRIRANRHHHRHSHRR